ncbi:uncharacterized protein LOC144209727 isoform X3 [Stigmatopora nigra]
MMFWWRLPQLTSDYTRDWSLISHKPHRETNDHSHSQSYDHQEGELSLRQATPMSAKERTANCWEINDGRATLLYQFQNKIQDTEVKPGTQTEEMIRECSG